MAAYRVVRDGEKVYVQRLDGPDAAGNMTWVVVATLRGSDIVQVAPRGFKRVDELDDQSLLYHIITGVGSR